METDTSCYDILDTISLLIHIESLEGLILVLLLLL